LPFAVSSVSFEGLSIERNIKNAAIALVYPSRRGLTFVTI
jgi:hypothetical protein